MLRELNDMFQGDTEKDVMVRKLLAEAEMKAKDMSIHLTKHEPNYYKKWDKNHDAEKDFLRRQKDLNTPNENYKYHKL